MSVSSHPARKLTDQPALFSAMLVLFFVFGFVTLMNDLLIPILRSRLDLSYAEAMLVQFFFFFTYFLMSLPMAWLLNKTSYKKSNLFGLLIIGLGCLIFIPADLYLVYGIFLFALFVLATGVVMLQVSVNPLVTVLGDPETSSARLTLAQGFNSLGTVLAPLLVGGIIFTTAIYVPYIAIAIALCFVAVFIGFFNYHSVDDDLDRAKIAHMTSEFILWKNLPFVFGLLGIFFYVGAEVTAGSLVINFLHLPEIAGFSLIKATGYLPIYWGGAMIGRFAGGSYLLLKVRPSKVLTINALMNIVLLVGVIWTKGHLAMWSLLLLGLFNSIMFPTIFSLAVGQLPNDYIKNKASGFLSMAIVGGAIVPELQGILADQIGLQMSFVLLFVCYAFILGYGVYRVRA